jgi:hypothetical protein
MSHHDHAYIGPRAGTTLKEQQLSERITRYIEFMRERLRQYEMDPSLLFSDNNSDTKSNLEQILLESLKKMRLSDLDDIDRLEKEIYKMEHVKAKIDKVKRSEQDDGREEVTVKRIPLGYHTYQTENEFHGVRSFYVSMDPVADPMEIKESAYYLVSNGKLFAMEIPHIFIKYGRLDLLLTKEVCARYGIRKDHVSSHFFMGNDARKYMAIRNEFDKSFRKTLKQYSNVRKFIQGAFGTYIVLFDADPTITYTSDDNEITHKKNNEKLAMSPFFLAIRLRSKEDHDNATICMYTVTELNGKMKNLMNEMKLWKNQHRHDVFERIRIPSTTHNPDCYIILLSESLRDINLSRTPETLVRYGQSIGWIMDVSNNFDNNHL